MYKYGVLLYIIRSGAIYKYEVLLYIIWSGGIYYPGMLNMTLPYIIYME